MIRLNFSKKTYSSSQEAEFLNARGCKELLDGNERRANQFFKKADKLALHKTKLLFNRASVYYQIGKTHLAVEVLSVAISSEPASELYHLRALCHASYSDNFEKLVLATEDFKKAGHTPEILWDLARTLFALSIQTEEAIELCESIELFEEVKGSFKGNFSFHLELFSVRLALSHKIRSEEMGKKALDILKEAQKIDVSADLDICFARAYKRVFELSGHMTYFNLSNTHFSKMQLKRPGSAELLYEWGELLKTASLLQHDPIFLQVALKKLEKAYEISPLLEHGLAYVKAVAYLSLFTDSIDELPKAAQILAHFNLGGAKEPELLYAEGLCSTALGYFHQIADFFEQGMEFFSAAIAHKSASSLFWHGAGICALGLSNIEGHESNIEKAITCFEKACQYEPSHDYTIDFAFARLKMAQFNQSLEILESSILLFETILGPIKTPRPEWLFHYACALRLRGEFKQSPELLHQAIAIFKQIERDEGFALLIHFELGISYSLAGEIGANLADLKLAIAHFEIVMRADIEHERAFCEVAVAQINLAHLTHGSNASGYKEAEKRLIHSARLGSLHALYYLGCLYSLSGMLDRSLFYLEKAKAYGALPPLEQVADDPWLDHVREHPEFKRLLEE